MAFGSRNTNFARFCGKPVIALLEKHGLKSFSEIVRLSRRRQQLARQLAKIE
jgi:hypothetical protein